MRNSLAELYYWLKGSYQNPSLQLACLQKASRLQPSNSQYHEELGKAFIASGQRAQAITHYERAILLNPTDSSLHLKLVGLLDTFSLQREVPPNYKPWREAISHHLRASIALFPHNPFVYNEAGLYLLGHWDVLDPEERQEALYVIRKTVELDNGKYTEGILQMLWEVTRDVSLLRGAIPEDLRVRNTVETFLKKLDDEGPE